MLAFVSGHSAFKKYFEEDDGVLTKLNLMEVFYRSLQECNLNVASDILRSFSKYLVEFEYDDIIGSMKLRFDLKRKGYDISYADALGYFLSKKMGIRFLTGDKTFRGLSGVKYVE